MCIRDSVEAPTIPFHEFDGYTIECWIRGWDTQTKAFNDAPIASQHPPFPWTARIDRVNHTSRYLTLGVHLPSLSSKLATDDWNHYAATDDGKKFRLFINGKLAIEYNSWFENLIKNQDGTWNQPFVIGKSSGQVEIAGRGLIRSLRVLNQPIYREPFTPPVDFDFSDERTELGFDFSDDQGLETNQVKDRSGHDRHGMLKNAWWIDGR